MKPNKFITIILLSIVITIASCTAVKATVSYLDKHQERYAKAVRIIENQCLHKMQEAATENNTQKLAYYRWRYENVDKVIADYGINSILESKKSY